MTDIAQDPHDLRNLLVLGRVTSGEGGEVILARAMAVLRAEFPNPKRDLLPGMFVRIRFPEAIAENAIRIPQRAVQAGPQGQFVMVVGAEGKATPQPVPSRM